MGATYNFSRIENSDEYITNRYDLLDLVEANYEKLNSYRKETITFQELISIQVLQNMDCLFDFGIYTRDILMFYDCSVVLGEYCSKYIDGSLLVILYSPKPILQVVNCILDSSYILEESKPSEQEVLQLNELKLMLEKAVENNDYVESYIDC